MRKAGYQMAAIGYAFLGRAAASMRYGPFPLSQDYYSSFILSIIFHDAFIPIICILLHRKEKISDMPRDVSMPAL